MIYLLIGAILYENRVWQKMTNKNLLYISDIIDELPDKWDFERNNHNGVYQDKTPAGGHKILTWWICDSCKSAYPMYAASKTGFLNLQGTKKTSPRGCSSCHNTKVSLISGYNDLVTLCPELVKNSWDYSKNNELKLFPNQLGPGSGKKAWWKCEYGHSYSMRIVSKTGMNSSGKKMYRPCQCPICSGQITVEGINDLETKYPAIASTWDFDKNILMPNQVHCGSSMDVWWKCEKGHSYKREVWSRVHSNLGCPICSGRYADPGKTDISTLSPFVAKLWDYNKNNANPKNVTLNTHTEYWFICDMCGKSYKSLPFNVHKSYIATGTCNCPVCHNSAGERAVGEFIKAVIANNGIDATVQLNNRTILKNRKELDIYIPELQIAVEFNGIYWHSLECLNSNKISNYRDHNKAVECYKYGIRLITIYENEWAQNTEAIKDFLENAIINANNKNYIDNSCIIHHITYDDMRNRIFSKTSNLSDYNMTIQYGKYISYISYTVQKNILMISSILSGNFECILKIIDSIAEKYQCNTIRIEADLNVSDTVAIRNYGYFLINIIEPELFDITSYDIKKADFIKHNTKNINTKSKDCIYSCGKMVFEKSN